MHFRDRRRNQFVVIHSIWEYLIPFLIRPFVLLARRQVSRLTFPPVLNHYLEKDNSLVEKYIYKSLIKSLHFNSFLWLIDFYATLIYDNFGIIFYLIQILNGT